MSKIFDQVADRMPLKAKRFTDVSFQVADALVYFMSTHDITCKMLALRLHHSESTIRKWLTGTCNFTLKDLVEIELLLDKKILNENLP